MRAIRLPGLDKAILSGTVGFISDLPTQLVAAFRATLEEVTGADLVLHVRDIANPDSEAQKRQVLNVLAELGLVDDLGDEREDGEAPRVPIVEVWNKWDLLPANRAADLREIIAHHPDEAIVPVSAVTGAGCDDLLEDVSRLLTVDAKTYSFLLPAGEGQKLAWLHAHGEVLAEEAAGEGEHGPLLRVQVRLSPREMGRYSRI
jgi:GTP-binding protein HflX